MKLSTGWNASLYNTKHNFVSDYGADLLLLLKPQPGEHILDLGCGTGTLANEIAKAGATVVGIDSSPEMIDKAKTDYPDIAFKVEDGQNFHFESQFDAVFSNAALHWMMEPKKVMDCVLQCLKPAGRFVFEMGGKNNVRGVLHAIKQTSETFHITHTRLKNYYPSLGEYMGSLEEQGFQAVYAHLFKRPTKLEGADGLRNWVRMFRGDLLQQIPEAQHEQFFEKLEEIARPQLYHEESWWADYVRLRGIAVKP